MSSPRKQMIKIDILPNISQSKGNQAIGFVILKKKHVWRFACLNTIIQFLSM